MNELLWLKDWYWEHRIVVRISVAVGLAALAHAMLMLWSVRLLRELSHVRERMSRLADGLALLTDTTEAGFATVIREVEQLSKRRAAPRPVTRATVAKRVVAAAEKGEALDRIAESELLSESEVRLHLKLAEAARRDVSRPAPAWTS